MPVNIKFGLPVIELLEKENIFTLTEERAKQQDIDHYH